MNSFADYQLVFYDPLTGAQIDIVTAGRIFALQYSRVVNDVGRFSLTVLASDRIATLNGTIADIFQDQVNILVDILRSTDGITFTVEDTYLLRYISKYSDENDIDYLVLAGDHCHSFLRDTLIIPDDDPLGANGFSTKSGIADTVMYSLVTNQCISPFTNADRTRAYITNAPSFNFGQNVFIRKSYDSLLEVLKELTVQGNVDFRLTRASGANFTFQVLLQGRDLTYTSNYPGGSFLLFAPERGNIRNPSFTIDRYNEVTVTYVATQGIENDRIITPVQSPEIYRPLNRRENIIDSREIEDGVSLIDGINTAGAAEIRAKQPVITFDFEVDTTASGGRYQLDWQLGDYVTAKYGTFMIDLRIISVDITLDSEKETIVPTFERLFS